MGPDPTQAEFKKWRNPVRGNSNAERMDNPFWKWCVNSRESAYAANDKFGGPDSFGEGPCWSFDRFGQAKITLPDEREIYIGGEHEDHYDPDFYIYNDVVIVDGDEISIFGYPESVFPPTDFHSATLVNSKVILIGNLGHPDFRKPGETQVLSLDVNSFEITQITCSGDNPGWIHDHSAGLNATGNAISISGGKKYGDRITENFHDYELCLSSFVWKKTVHRNWTAWILERDDEQPNGLWEIRSEFWNRQLGISTKDTLAQALPDLPKEILAELSPKATKEQLDLILNLYQSPFDHSPAIEDEDCHGRFRLTVDDTTVRIDEEMLGITVTIEGELPDSKSEKILFSLRDKLSEIETAAYKITPIEN